MSLGHRASLASCCLHTPPGSESQSRYESCHPCPLFSSGCTQPVSCPSARKMYLISSRFFRFQRGSVAPSCFCRIPKVFTRKPRPSTFRRPFGARYYWIAGQSCLPKFVPIAIIAKAATEIAIIINLEKYSLVRGEFESTRQSCLGSLGAAATTVLLFVLAHFAIQLTVFIVQFTNGASSAG